MHPIPLCGIQGKYKNYYINLENNKVRTYNPSLKRRILYQLSYIPTERERREK